MIKAVKDYIDKYNMIEDNDTIVVGVSGGADSVCLLLLLHEYRSFENFKLAVVHMNHMIRANASEDAAYVEKLCEKLELPFFLYEEDIQKRALENSQSTEEAGRYARYQAFNKTLNQLGGKGKIAVAHNQNDCAETMLFHIFRGTGLTGLAGILPVRDNIIRPILCLNRKQIEDYLKKQKVTWCIDFTNEENTYTRNKIRNVILPFAEKEICINSTEHIAKAAFEMAEIREYFEEQTKKAVLQTVSLLDKEVVIKVDKFLLLPNIIQRQVLLFCMNELIKGRKDISAMHILSIQELFDKSGSKEIHLPYQLEALKKYNEVIIRKKKAKNKNFYYQEVMVPETIELPSGKKVKFTLLPRQKDENIPEKTYTKWFDYDKILHCLVLRNRKTGDYLTINQSMERKTIKDYLIQEKVPREERDSLIFLADENHILWALGLRISENYKVTEDTKQILQVTIE